MKQSMKVPMVIKTLLVFLVIMILSSPMAFGADTIPKMDKHKSKGISCTACHKSSPYTRSEDVTCMTCHGSYADLAKKTAGLENLKAGIQNPHKSHIGEARCTVCHKNHASSVLYCNECHSPKFEMKVP
ncbi:MAG: cytochrome c3 family protein [Smithellaceae bacterium]